MTNPNQLTQQELQAWERCQEFGEEFTRLSQADQVILTKMIERQLTQGTAHFREQAEAWVGSIAWAVGNSNCTLGICMLI